MSCGFFVFSLPSFQKVSEPWFHPFRYLPRPAKAFFQPNHEVWNTNSISKKNDCKECLSHETFQWSRYLKTIAAKLVFESWMWLTSPKMLFRPSFFQNFSPKITQNLLLSIPSNHVSHMFNLESFSHSNDFWRNPKQDFNHVRWREEVPGNLYPLGNQHIPPWDIGKSSSKCHFWGIC